VTTQELADAVEDKARQMDKVMRDLRNTSEMRGYSLGLFVSQLIKMCEEARK
jgi:hypothetical protein